MKTLSRILSIVVEKYGFEKCSSFFYFHIVVLIAFVVVFLGLIVAVVVFITLFASFVEMINLFIAITRICFNLFVLNVAVVLVA